MSMPKNRETKKETFQKEACGVVDALSLLILIASIYGYISGKASEGVALSSAAVGISLWFVSGKINKTT